MTAETLSRETVTELARDTLAATADWFPSRPEDDVPEHIVWAAAYVARLRQLLSAATTLIENREDDSVGALFRPLFETYLNGLYVFLGGEDAVDALRRALLHETHQLEKAFGRATKEDEHPDAKKLPVSQHGGDGLVQRVDELLAKQSEEYRGWVVDFHRRFYRITSFHDTHGGLGSLNGYTSQPDNEPPTIKPAREDAATALHLHHHAISLVIGLAGIWGLKNRPDIAALQNVAQQLDDAAPDEL